MITVMIDEMTHCLKDAKTFEIFETEVIELERKSFLAKFNKKTGWHVNWSETYSIAKSSESFFYG